MPSPGDGLDETAIGGRRLVIGVEYLNFWLSEGRVPALLTTGSPASQGILGRPGSEIIYGNDRLQTRHGDQFAGIRPTLTYWCDDERTLGVEASAFFLERDSTYFRANSNGSLLLARPYFNAAGNAASQLIAGPAPAGPLSGQFVGYSRIELFSEEANVFARLLRRDGFRLDIIGGARFAQLRDRNDLTSSSQPLAEPGTLLGLEDHFRASNSFYGAQVGLNSQFTNNRWTVDVRKTFALGANEEEIRQFGTTVFATPFTRIQTPTGLLVQQNNTGTFHRSVFAMLSSIQVNVSYRLTDHFSLLGGYTLLLWESPVRAGDQINTTVNTNPTAPANVSFREDLFWAQGFTLGLAGNW